MSMKQKVASLERIVAKKQHQQGDANSPAQINEFRRQLLVRHGGKTWDEVKTIPDDQLGEAELDNPGVVHFWITRCELFAFSPTFSHRLSN